MTHEDGRGNDGPSPDEMLPGVLRIAAAGAEIFRRGELFTGLYQVLRGSVLLYREQDSGEEITVMVVRPGEVFGVFATTDFGPHGTSARALTRTTLLFVSAEEIRRGTTGDSRVRIEQALARHARAMLERVELLARTSVEERLLAFMAMRATPDGRGGAWVELPGTRAQLASELATSRETVSRVLARLKRDGLIEECGRRIHVAEAALLNPRPQVTAAAGAPAQPR